MTRLIRHSFNRWSVTFCGERVATKATLTQAKASALWVCGVDPHEFLEGVRDMEENGNDVADFGVNGTFIFSRCMGKRKYATISIALVV